MKRSSVVPAAAILATAVGLGAVADAIDLKTALTICAIAPAIGVIFCLRLPAPAKRAQSLVDSGPAVVLPTD